MSKLVIKSSTDFRTFLKVLAEESVATARADMSAKAQQQKIAADIKKSKSSFMKEEDPVPSAAEPAPAPPDEKADSAPTPVEQPQSDAEISPKFDSLVDAINTLRGTPSTKDSAVESQLRSYYDKLDSAEAASAILYLRSIADVMSGRVDGSRAQDPSDFSITTTMKQDKSEPAGQSEPKVAAPSTPTATPSSSPGEEENTAPPIKVGGQQVTEAYRKKIRELIGN